MPVTRVSTSQHRSTRGLLIGGVVATPLLVILWAVQAFTRSGFRASFHPMSLLSLGDLGWMQIVNFVLTGALVIGGGVGLGRALEVGRLTRWASALIIAMGVGLVVAGVFVTDAGSGFPEGAPPGAPEMSWHGALHEAGFVLTQLELPGRRRRPCCQVRPQPSVRMGTRVRREHHRRGLCRSTGRPHKSRPPTRHQRGPRARAGVGASPRIAPAARPLARRCGFEPRGGVPGFRSRPAGLATPRCDDLSTTTWRHLQLGRGHRTPCNAAVRLDQSAPKRCIGFSSTLRYAIDLPRTVTRAALST